ncbi:MAG TPA: hypothetical protein VI548_06345 [Chitinophagaceae bacterium]|nr:hypothetical protein [Chitinophagaceae bacterium]
MKKILSEKNIVAILFLLVFVAFTFAHEDSKKRYKNYQVSFPAISPANSTTLLLSNQENPAPETRLVNPVVQD